MNAVRIFVALLILLVSSPPVFARVPGCMDKGRFLNPLAYVFYVHQPASRATGCRLGSGAAGVRYSRDVIGGRHRRHQAFFGITQWKGSAGNVRGRLSLPTATPDAVGYLTRSVDILADNPAWPVKCWEDGRVSGRGGNTLTRRRMRPVSRCGRQAVANDSTATAAVDPTGFRPSNGVSYSLFANGSVRGLQWGLSSDAPAPGDYDGDGKADIAVYRPSSGRWFWLRSIANNTQSDTIHGARLRRPVPADYDGDRIDDIAVYRPSNGTWYLRFSDQRCRRRRGVGQDSRHSRAGRL